jgi:hypothetical protein
MVWVSLSDSRLFELIVIAIVNRSDLAGIERIPLGARQPGE